MRWKRSKTCSSCSAVVDWAASTKWRSTGSTSSQRGWPMKGRRVRRVAGPRHGEEVADGVGVEDRVSTTIDLGAQRLEHLDGLLAGGGAPRRRRWRSRGWGRRRPGRGRGGRRGRPATMPRGGAGRAGRSGRGRRPRRGRGRRRRCGGPWGRWSRGRASPGGLGPPAGTRPRRRLHAREAAAGRGDPDGAAAVGSGGERDHARPPGRPPRRPRTRRPPGRVERVQRWGRRGRWSCCPSSRTRACWSCRRRRSRPPAGGPRRGRRRWRAGRRRGAPSRRWCGSRRRPGGP